MASTIRAYYLPAESVSDIDASHPVSVEQLNTLGWKLSSVGGGPDEITQAGQKIAQELGFPVAQEGCLAPFNFDFELNAATLTPEMTALLMKVAEIKNGDSICFAKRVVVVVTSGNPYVDVEDVTTTGWVRIHLDAGTLLRVPAGAKYRIPFNEKTKGTTGIAFFEGTISNHGFLAKKEIDSHPTRQAYLNEVGQT